MFVFCLVWSIFFLALWLIKYPYGGACSLRITFQARLVASDIILRGDGSPDLSLLTRNARALVEDAESLLALMEQSPVGPPTQLSAVAGWKMDSKPVFIRN